MGDDYRIQVSGDGKLEAGALAIGPNAEAFAAAREAMANPAYDEIRRRFEELVAAVQSDGGELPARRAIVAATTKVAEGLGRSPSDKRGVQKVLREIAAMAQSVTAISNAATALSQAIGTAA